jgi:PhzF family phenazine biosynthesis protein
MVSWQGAASAVEIPIYQVDAFADAPFAGNPAAVCLLPAFRNSQWMQSVAAEMNLSETAFLLAESNGFRLRWFTPRMEVDLCGHATLAAAHILWTETEHPETERLEFHTASGTLAATRQDERIELDFPAEPASPAEPPCGLMDALGLHGPSVRHIARNRMDALVEVDSEATLRSVMPDFPALAQTEVRGTIVTSRATSAEYDFVSRFFAPRAGVDEDPVTGSAHCCLGPYWQQQLGKGELVARQISLRGGVVRVRVADDRVYLGGTAVTILRGALSDEAIILGG